MLVALLIVGTATAAAAHPNIQKWWQYDKTTWHHSWHHYSRYRQMDNRWEDNHPHADPRESKAEHHRLRHRYRKAHFHRTLSFQRGEATWYDGNGQTGACGVPLKGMYAASRTLPCGALVSVRHHSHYVFVRILDRGPYGSSSRILDLSPAAFKVLGPLGAGVIQIRAFRLHRE